MSNYKSVPVQIVGGDVQSRSRQWNSQASVNMYPDVLDSGRSLNASLCWPGRKAFASITGQSSIRCLFTFRGELYAVAGVQLHRINEAGTVTTIGGFIAGDQRLAVSASRDYVMFRQTGSCDFINGRFVLCGQGTTYLYNGTSITELQLPQGMNDIAVGVTNISTVDTSVDPLRPEVLQEDIIAADATTDEVLQVKVFQQKIYVGGTNSIQIFYLTGQSPPIAPYDQAVSNSVGIASRFAMANTNTYLYFVGSDNAVYRMASAQVELISDSAISAQLRNIDTSDMRCWVTVIDGQQFFIMQAFAANFTVAYSEQTQVFIRLTDSTDPNQITASLAVDYIYFKNRHLVSVAGLAAISEWDLKTYTNGSTAMMRQIQTSPINGEPLGVFGDTLVFGFMDVKLEITPGNATAPGTLQIFYSTDGGLTYKAAENIDMTPTDSTFYRGRWNACFAFHDMSVRMVVVDPVFTGFHSASVALQKGGY